eukprot:363862-Chlamydomonas_euryale.AAC.11
MSYTGCGPPAGKPTGAAWQLACMLQDRAGVVACSMPRSCPLQQPAGVQPCPGSTSGNREHLEAHACRHAAGAACAIRQSHTLGEHNPAAVPQ